MKKFENSSNGMREIRAGNVKDETQRKRILIMEHGNGILSSARLLTILLSDISSISMMWKATKIFAAEPSALLGGSDE